MIEQKTPINKKFAFVLMPFKDEFNDIYSLIIEPALKAENYDVKRADSFLDQRNILKDIIQYIDKAKIIIAEISSLNPNVMYELGIAHGLLKPTVIITQDIESLPFDLRPYRVIPYSNNHDGLNDLREKLVKIVRQQKDETIIFENPVTDFAPQYKTREVLLKYFLTKQEKEKLVGKIDFELVDKTLKGLTETTTNWVEYLKERISLETKFHKQLDKFLEEHIQIKNDKLDMLKAGIITTDDSKEKEIINPMIKSIEDYIKEIEELLTMDTMNWNEFVKRTRELIFFTSTIKDLKHKRNIVKYNILLEEYKRSISKSIVSLDSSPRNLEGLKGISNEFDFAIERLKLIDKKLLETYKIRESDAQRIQNLISERLEI